MTLGCFDVMTDRGFVHNLHLQCCRIIIQDSKLGEYLKNG